MRKTYGLQPVSFYMLTDRTLGNSNALSPHQAMSLKDVFVPTTAWVSDDALYKDAPVASYGQNGQIWYADLAHNLGRLNVIVVGWRDPDDRIYSSQFLVEQRLEQTNRYNVLRVWLQDKPLVDLTFFVLS